MAPPNSGHNPAMDTTTSLTDLFREPPQAASVGNQAQVEANQDEKEEVSESTFLIPMKGLSESVPKQHQQSTESSAFCQFDTCRVNLGISTWIGSFTALMYHTVFCLAHSAALVRPNADHSSMGVLAQMAALGVCAAGTSFVYQVGPYVPAAYPSSDLFLAPFLAVMASEVDSVLAKYDLQNDDTIFFATFGSLVVTAMILGGIICVLAARIKLANLGNFLPYPVLTGFFSTVGVLIWMLGFSVDSNGIPVSKVVTSGDAALIQTSLLHHLPSLVAGILMHVTARQHPFFVMFWIFVTVIVFYLSLAVTRTPIETARDHHWFFSAEDLQGSENTNSTYGPPWPFGIWPTILAGNVHLEAYMAGIKTVLALVFLYLLRCSLHAAALKKLIPKVTRKPPLSTAASQNTVTASSRRFGKKKAPLTLDYLLEHGYAYSQLVAGMVGGISVAPSVGASMTLFHLGAEGMEPQFGSVFLLVFLYLTNFSIVQYIPKPAFSSLMVLAGLDMLRAWLVDSYFKTKVKLEWLVAPTLVVLALAIGFLNAVFVGVALSTFLFVGSFHQVGTVKFVGNGLNLRSTVERGNPETAWLSENGDWIQILVLQNYLFFGNCQSVHHYVSTMFDDQDQVESLDAAMTLPPMPKHLIIDFQLVTGMDTSAVDLFSEIISLCEKHKCQLYLSAVSSSMKSTLAYAGIKPSSERRFHWTFDLETALAKAEDKLITQVFHIEEKDELESSMRRQKRSESIDLRQTDDGFLYALRKIDEQHGLHTADELASLSVYTKSVDLKPGEVLLRRNGLYFIETGLMRVQSSASGYTSTTNTVSQSQSVSTPLVEPSLASIGHLNARSSTIGRQTALWKAQKSDLENHPERTEQTFRLARIGQGWILGSIEMATHGMKRPGAHVASSPCRLHFLPAEAVHRAETENPIAVMHLYKLLAFLATKRQEVTIEQLGQFVHILNSPTPRLRGGKPGLARLLKQTPIYQDP